MIHRVTARLQAVNVIYKPAAYGRTNCISLHYIKCDLNFKTFTTTGEIIGTTTTGSFSDIYVERSKSTDLWPLLIYLEIYNLIEFHKSQEIILNTWMSRCTTARIFETGIHIVISKQNCTSNPYLNDVKLLHFIYLLFV